MIRVLYLATGLEVGGTERALERLIQGLDRSRFLPALHSLKGEGPVGRRLAAAGVAVSGGLAGLWGAIRRFRPDILHSFLVHANVAGRIAGRLAGVRRIVSSIRTLEGGPLHAALERLTSGLADETTFVSDAVASHARRRFGIPGGVVIPNGVPPGAVATGGEVVTVGRLAPGKGAVDFVRASLILGRKFPGVTFALVGDGPERERLQVLVGSARIRFAGFQEDPSAELAKAAVFVHSSRLGEGLPNAVLEAMAAGLPVVATDVGGTREAVVEGETGFLLRPGDVEAIADRVGRLLADRGLARAMGARGRARVAERFSLSAMVAANEALYERLAGPVRDGGP